MDIYPINLSFLKIAVSSRIILALGIVSSVFFLFSPFLVSPVTIIDGIIISFLSFNKLIKISSKVISSDALRYSRSVRILSLIFLAFKLSRLVKILSISLDSFFY